MNKEVLESLAPVVLLVALGYAVGRLRLLRAEAVKDLSNLVFLVLSPALLFRTMSKAGFANLDGSPLLAYFLAALLLFALVMVFKGFNRRAAVLAVGATYGNMVMVGIAFVSLVYGEPGLVTLFSLLSVHALIVLTTGSVVLELAVAHEKHGGRPGWRALGRTILGAIKSSLLHPIPLPIIAGLLYAQTGWGLPTAIDKPLQWLGSALGPLALMLVGVTLAGGKARSALRGALAITVLKNLALPVMVAVAAVLLGITGLPLVVMLVTASLPCGANVFLFAQRYQVAEELATAAITVSTVSALVTMPLVMYFAARLAY